MDRPAEIKDQAREFRADELFFSMTDTRGVITAWNEVFVRISGYPAEELRGRPHNIIRHPHMPRGVFQILWETLQAGKPFSGYVKNLASDGCHYWVYAVAVPIDDGYLSVRFKPTGPLLASTIEGLYRDALAHEHGSGRGTVAADTARGGARFLRERLAAMGFADYTAFSEHAFAEEMRHRDQWLRQAERSEPAVRLEAAPGAQGRELAELYPVARQASIALNALFAKLDAFSTISGELRRKAGSVLQVTEDFHLNAMNANIAAQRLGAQAVSLGTVATFLGHYGQILTREIGGLDRQIASTTQATEAAMSSLATARLQMEMILSYMAELGGQADGAGSILEVTSLTRLERAFAATLRRTRDAVRQLQIRVPEVRIQNDTLLKTVLSLEMTQVSGLTEAARWAEGSDLRDMFASFRSEIAGVRGDLEKLGAAAEDLARLVDATPRALINIAEDTAPLKHRFGALAGAHGVEAD